MKVFFTRAFVFGCLLTLPLAACNPTAPAVTPTPAISPAVKAIETYWTALAAKDTEQLVNASCADWEEGARLELDSFAAVTPKLEGLKCQENGTDGEATVVTCDGKLVLDYNGEIQELSLADFNYLAVQEGGEWRMCGRK